MMKLIRCSLPPASIDGIDLYMVDMNVQIHHHLVFYIGQGYLNVCISVMCVENLALGLLIIFIKNMIT